MAGVTGGVNEGRKGRGMDKQNRERGLGCGKHLFRERVIVFWGGMVAMMGNRKGRGTEV